MRSTRCRSADRSIFWMGCLMRNGGAGAGISSAALTSIGDGAGARIVGPDAMHLRHDHRAARAVFLLVMRVAHPHRVRSGIVMRHDALLLIIRRDAKTGHSAIARRRRRVLR